MQQHFFKTPVPTFRKPHPRAAILAIAAISAMITGRGEPRVPVYPVSGSISFNGQAPAGAQVVLHRIGSPVEEGISPTGVVQSDGTFNIGVYEPNDGAPEGEYVATVQWFRLVAQQGGGGARGPNVLPAQYAQSTTSPIKVAVNGSPTVIPPIVIQK